MTEKQIADSYLGELKDRFKNKITPDEYYLAYSGGKDSHLLYWFIKEILHDDEIRIVGVNTGFEIPEIRDRILKNSDIVLHPAKSRWEIKEQYGIPCYSKQQDEYIHRYQCGSRSANTMRFINGENPILNLNRTARENLLAGKLHKISNKCCDWNKEIPMQRYGKESGRKAIIGVRQSESRTRKAKYTSCLTTAGNFTPLYDWSDDLVSLIYSVYKIEIPSCYQYVSRTGCAGCPYGRNVEKELALLPRLQRERTIKYFKESYDIKNLDYRNLQLVIPLE